MCVEIEPDTVALRKFKNFLNLRNEQSASLNLKIFIIRFIILTK